MGYTQERTKQVSKTGDDQVTKTEKEHCRVSSFADGLELNLFRKELTVLPPPPSAICCNMQSPFDLFTIYLLLSEYVLISRRHFVARLSGMLCSRWGESPFSLWNSPEISSATLFELPHRP